MIRVKLMVCGIALLLVGGLGILYSGSTELASCSISESEANQVRGGCDRVDNIQNICSDTCFATGCATKANPGTYGGDDPSDVSCTPKPGITSCGKGTVWASLGDNACMGAPGS